MTPPHPEQRTAAEHAAYAEQRLDDAQRNLNEGETLAQAQYIATEAQTHALLAIYKRLAEY